MILTNAKSQHEATKTLRKAKEKLVNLDFFAALSGLVASCWMFVLVLTLEGVAK